MTFQKGYIPWNKGKKMPSEACEKISKSLREQHRSGQRKLAYINMSKSLMGHPVSKETLKKLSESHKGQRAWNKGIKGAIKHTDESKRKLRLARIKSIELNNGQCWPNYNPRACEFFKSFDEQYNTKGRYAIHGDGEYLIEELGYFPDYINFNLKLIMEYDEPHHYDKKGNLKNKDKVRQQKIEEYYPDFEFRRVK